MGLILCDRQRIEEAFLPYIIYALPHDNKQIADKTVTMEPYKPYHYLTTTRVRAMEWLKF